MVAVRWRESEKSVRDREENERVEGRVSWWKATKEGKNIRGKIEENKGNKWIN